MLGLANVCDCLDDRGAQYGIDLPGSLHTNKIPVILGRYPLPRFFGRLSIVPLDMDNGTFNSSHTDVVEKVNFLIPIARGQKWLCFGHFSRGGILPCGSSQKRNSRI